MSGTCPSVEAEKHSVPVLACSQIVLYAGSLWLCSIGVMSTGCEPLLVSQYADNKQRVQHHVINYFVNTHNTTHVRAAMLLLIYIIITDLPVVLSSNQNVRVFRIVLNAYKR